jgi:hypothetical protein
MQTDDGLTDDDVSEFGGSIDEDDNDDAPPRDSALTGDDEAGGARNSLLAVGQAHNRSFVVRGSQVGVFKQTHDDDLEFVSTLSPLRSARGAALTPSRAMLHQRDTSLLLTDESDPQRLYRMDLNRGDVVETWESSSNVRELLPEKKGAQATDSPVLLGMNSKAFFALDARQAGDKCVSSRLFQYSGRSPQLSCAATTGNGQIVLGTENGDVRLFSAKRSLLSTPDIESRKPRASTNLPGFGDAVTAVDATEDGAWVLATCRTYLMCICTTIGASNGFESRMGQQKPAPRRLQLSAGRRAARGRHGVVHAGALQHGPDGRAEHCNEHGPVGDHVELPQGEAERARCLPDEGVLRRRGAGPFRTRHRSQGRCGTAKQRAIGIKDGRHADKATQMKASENLQFLFNVDCAAAVRR